MENYTRHLHGDGGLFADGVELPLDEFGRAHVQATQVGKIALRAEATDVDGLVGMGASGGDSHGPGEYIELDSLPRQAKRAALLIYRLSQTPR